MPRSLLPPKGVIIPPSIAYDKKMSPAARDTYVQLRGLAWGKTETPPLTMPELSDITGKSVSTLYGHLAYLRDWGVLRYVSTGDKRVTVTFIDQDTADSRNSECLLNIDSSILNESINQEEKDIVTFQKSGVVQKTGKHTIASKSSKADQRSFTPAIQCVKSVTSRFPPKELYDDIIRVLGDKPDKELLTTCRKEWVKRGYNPNGWGWLIDWYLGGIPSRSFRQSSSQASKTAVDYGNVTPEEWAAAKAANRKEQA